MTITRRRFTQTTGATLVAICGAGCQALSSKQGTGDVVVHNQSSVTKTASIEITDVNDGYAQFRKTLTLEPKEKKKFNDTIVLGTDNEVVVDIRNGQRDEWAWNDVSNTIHIVLNGTGITSWLEH